MAGLFLDQNERNWERIINLNLVSMLAATHAAVPVMIRGGHGGAVLNVSSIEGGRAAPNYSVYGACKSGMNNFTRTMALELAEHRIRVNAIAPDHTVTPGIRGNATGPVDESTWIKMTPERQAAVNRGIPLDRTGVPEECGDAAVFLCSEMSAYVTGTVMPVDGGTWASSGWTRTAEGRWTLNAGPADDLSRSPLRYITIWVSLFAPFSIRPILGSPASATRWRWRVWPLGTPVAQCIIRQLSQTT